MEMGQSVNPESLPTTAAALGSVPEALILEPRKSEFLPPLGSTETPLHP